jgi:GR25 family glycosyltransferase involved in LPS biosynthesis
MKACVFINLPAATARRASVEASFTAANTEGWYLRRFGALGPDNVADLSGTLKPAEKACFASHRAALGACLGDEEHALIVEDDAVFAPQAFGVVDALFAQNPGWDVIYTDVAICDLSLMVHLANRRDAMVGQSEFLTIDLAGRSYAGAAAYAVRGSAKQRLHAALSVSSRLDQPIDLFLRDLAHGPDFKIGVSFPFLTAPAGLADAGSQIQGEEVALFDATFNAYRRLMFVERNMDQCRADSERLSAHTDETARLVGGVFAAIVSPAFPLDR